MAIQTISDFRGIAPNRAPFDGQAELAENVDLSGRGLKAVRASSFVEAGHTGEIVFHNGSWVSGEENYISTDVNGIPALISKTNQGQWKINVNGVTTHDLWLGAPSDIEVTSAVLQTPDAPRSEIEGSGNIPEGEYEYFARFAQYDADGNRLRSSSFSSAVSITITASDGRVKFYRPDNFGGLPELTKWQIFRRKVGDTYARLVSETNKTQAILSDDNDNSGLGEAAIPEDTASTRRDYRYVVVWVRNIGGWIHESVPSEIFPITQEEDGVNIKLNDSVPSGVTGWRIYRISVGFEPTTTFQLVEEMLNTDTEYLDYKRSVELGAALQSSYRADNGALVTAGVPSGQFEGMAGPFNGFYVGWIGRDLYLSEPGNPAWWPGAYVVQASFNIKAIIQTRGNIAVVTEGGVQVGYGVSPDAFALSQAVFGAGGAYRTAASESFYLGYNGIYQMSEGGATLITVDFDQSYFDALSNPWLVQEKERLILFHSEGALVYDFKTQQWTTLSANQHSFTSVHASGGEIYGLRNNVIVKLFGSEDFTNFIYEGTVAFDAANTKRIDAIKVTGSGTATISLYQIEDEDTADTTGTVDMNSTYDQDRMIYPPAWLHTEALRYRISGNPAIRAMMFDVVLASTER